MTDFEKSLLTGYIIAADDSVEMSKNIIKAVGGEVTTTVGDEIQSAVIHRIQKYLETLCDDKDQITLVMENDIIPQVACCNYINTISSIENFENRYKH